MKCNDIVRDEKENIMSRKAELRQQKLASRLKQRQQNCVPIQALDFYRELRHPGRIEMFIPFMLYRRNENV